VISKRRAGGLELLFGLDESRPVMTAGVVWVELLFGYV
jgi:hypothetical protein